MNEEQQMIESLFKFIKTFRKWHYTFDPLPSSKGLRYGLEEGLITVEEKDGLWIIKPTPKTRESVRLWEISKKV
jgi:hypothetical protein